MKQGYLYDLDEVKHRCQVNVNGEISNNSKEISKMGFLKGAQWVILGDLRKVFLSITIC